MRFVRDHFPVWGEEGHVSKVEGKGRSILIVGETPDANDALTQRIVQVLRDFDNLEIKVETRKIRPRYVDVTTVMKTIAMRGLANVWQISETTTTASWKEENKQLTSSAKSMTYVEAGLMPGANAPIPVPPKIPYVYEIPSMDPFEVPRNYGASAPIANQPLVDFRFQPSTEERGALMAVGTFEDLEAIQAFIDIIDVPARQIMIEVQVVELDASKFTDLGIDSVQFGDNHTLVNTALSLPGEGVIQPGFGPTVRRDPSMFVPPITQQGVGLIFDDTSKDITGRFIATIHALVREGDATVRARPKILTLDDRVSVLHIGETVPSFQSTGVTRDATVGNFVTTVNNVTNIYVGFTLNLRPRITGGAEDEVCLETEVNVNLLGQRERVFAEDLLGIPNIYKREYVGMNRVKNHRPIVLGGLIQDSEFESANKIPILGDIPYLGFLFRRTVTEKRRKEVILILTPHILSDKGWDRAATPKESAMFDTFDSALFNDSHIIKGRDVIGVDPITGSPARSPDGKIFTEEQVVDLTLLNIVKERELVSKLGIIDDYIGEGAKDLSWIQRKWPERTVHSWPDDRKEIYFRAAAIVIENVKELNPDLNFEEIVTPRREIILPTTPYRISLSYDKVKTLQQGYEPYLRGVKMELTEKTVGMMWDASGRSLREFADFLATRNRKAEDHGEMLPELKRMHSGQNPTSNALEGIPYPAVYRQLAGANFDFVSVATYFRENLANRYQVTGVPDVGLFERDLKAFIEASVSLHQRAKTLMELEDRWQQLNTLADEEVAPEKAAEAEVK